MVHGGRNPARVRWLKLCLEALAQCTIYPNYHIYVWNNDVGAVAARELTAGLSRCTLIDADPLEQLKHPHAQGLQRLYERARSDGAHYVVTFDTDAMPIKTGWLTALIEAIDAGAALAGVWRDEAPQLWEPSVHPSCLCTTIDFVDHHKVRTRSASTTFCGNETAATTRLRVLPQLPAGPASRSTGCSGPTATTSIT